MNQYSEAIHYVFSKENMRKFKRSLLLFLVWFGLFCATLGGLITASVYTMLEGK